MSKSAFITILALLLFPGLALLYMAIFGFVATTDQCVSALVLFFLGVIFGILCNNPDYWEVKL